ncbi:hypothetical protein ABBQ32_000873 [Trebouxia sp. C0010 RCD-2024]
MNTTPWCIHYIAHQDCIEEVMKKRIRTQCAHILAPSCAITVCTHTVNQQEQKATAADKCRMGLDIGRKSLFTAAIHSQSAADNSQQQHSFGINGTQYSTLSWSSGRWWEASALGIDIGPRGINYRLNKTPLWLGQNFTLKDALEQPPQQRSISAGSKDTIVAYGDASFSSSCSKGNPSTPTVSLRRNLGYHCKVFDTDEFRTSRLSCACKTTIDGMPLPVTGTCCKKCSTLHET